MEFYVNGQQLDITLENEKTVGEVLRSFETTCIQNKCATIGVTINGIPVTADIFDEEAAKPITENLKIEATVVSEDNVADAFKDAAVKIKALVTELTEIPVNMQNGNDAKAKKSIAALADTIDDFCHIVAMSALFSERFGTIKIEGKSLSEFFSDFSPVLQELNGALESEDTVLTGDLAVYEICPRLNALCDAVKDF